MLHIEAAYPRHHRPRRTSKKCRNDQFLFMSGQKFCRYAFIVSWPHDLVLLPELLHFGLVFSLGSIFLDVLALLVSLDGKNPGISVPHPLQNPIHIGCRRLGLGFLLAGLFQQGIADGQSVVAVHHELQGTLAALVFAGRVKLQPLGRKLQLAAVFFLQGIFLGQLCGILSHLLNY